MHKFEALPEVTMHPFVNTTNGQTGMLDQEAHTDNINIKSCLGAAADVAVSEGMQSVKLASSCVAA